MCIGGHFEHLLQNACYRSQTFSFPFFIFIYFIRIIIHRIIILPVVFHGFHTWHFLINEGHRLRMLENRVPRSTFGSKTKEEVGKLTKIALHGASSFPHSTKHFLVTRSRRANLQVMWRGWRRTETRLSFLW
jgi:hypothetical protein